MIGVFTVGHFFSTNLICSKIYICCKIVFVFVFFFFFFVLFFREFWDSINNRAPDRRKVLGIIQG